MQTLIRIAWTIRVRLLTLIRRASRIRTQWAIRLAIRSLVLNLISWAIRIRNRIWLLRAIRIQICDSDSYSGSVGDLTGIAQAHGGSSVPNSCSDSLGGPTPKSLFEFDDLDSESADPPVGSPGVGDTSSPITLSTVDRRRRFCMGGA